LSTLLEALDARELGYKPGAIAELGDGGVVEIVSYPFPREDGTLGIMVRTEPADPCSMVEATVPSFAATLGAMSDMSVQRRRYWSARGSE